MRDSLMFVAHWSNDTWGVWELHITHVEGELDTVPEFQGTQAEAIAWAAQEANERMCTYGMTIAGELKENAANVDLGPRREDTWEPNGDSEGWGVREL